MSMSVAQSAILSINTNALVRRFDNVNTTTTGDHRDSRILTIGTTEESVAINTDITGGSDPGLMYIYNLDSTNYVQFGVATTVYSQRIPAGKFSIFWLEAAIETLYFKANTASVKVEFLILER